MIVSYLGRLLCGRVCSCVCVCVCSLCVWSYGCVFSVVFSVVHGCSFAVFVCVSCSFQMFALFWAVVVVL